MQLTDLQQGLSIPTDQEMLSREATTSLVIPVYSALLQNSDSNLPSNVTPGDPINLLTTNYRVNAALPTVVINNGTMFADITPYWHINGQS